MRIPSLTLVAVALLASGCQTGGGSGRALSVTGAALPPAGMAAFCAAEPDACRAARPGELPALSAERRDELAAVNRAVNGTFAYADDRAGFGRVEVWAYPVTAGDCEDLALEKQRRLRALGWPRDALLLAQVDAPRVGPHAVLLVLTADGEFVLDNRDPQVRPQREVPYRWVRRQSREDPKTWVSFGPSRQQQAAVPEPTEPAPPAPG